VEDQIQMKDAAPMHWWKGTRGEWYVFIQVCLIVLIFFGPRNCGSLGNLQFPSSQLCPFVGAGLAGVGGMVLLAGLIRLGSNLTPLPFPKDEASLVQTGPYSFVRHPMYCGGILLAFGWAILVRGWLTVIFAIVMLLFLDIKSRREEQWLSQKYPDYRDYQRRVRKLIPFIY
jgi:protein-S-isoprenylcysteine O-methyltransferase Ste14